MSAEDADTFISSTHSSIKKDGDAAPERSKSIKLLDALTFVFGGIVGSGIFIAVSEPFGVSSTSCIGLVVILWVIGGIITLIGGMCYVELGTRVPESGGERAYYAKALNQKFSAVFVIMYVFVVKSITLAALSVTVGVYFEMMLTKDAKEPSIISKFVAVGILLLCFGVNCFSKLIATKANVVLTILKTVALFIIIGCGIYYISIGEAEEWKKPFEVTDFNVLNLAMAAINIFWAYEGWNTLGLIAGDMKNPNRDLPLAIIAGVSAVVVLYVAAIISYSAVLGFDTVKSTETVANDLGKKVLLSFSPIIPILICCSAAGSTNSNLYAIGGVAMSGGYTGVLPKVFSLVHRKKRTPVVSFFVITLVSLIFVPIKLQTLFILCAFISWTFYFISFVCLWIFKIKPQFNVSGKKIFQVPYVAIVTIQLVCLFIICMAFYIQKIWCPIILALMLATLGYQYIPLRYRQFKRLGAFHDRFSSFLKKYLNLEEATLSDVS